MHFSVINWTALHCKALHWYTPHCTFNTIHPVGRDRDGSPENPENSQNVEREKLSHGIFADLSARKIFTVP
jgi:hypothetical protein